MNDNDRKPSALKEARRGTTAILLVATAVLVVAALFYFGLGGTDAAQAG